MFCDNRNSSARGGIVSPGCYANEATKKIKISYDKHDIETDTLDLCDQCVKVVGKDARRHGYKVETIR